MASVNLEFSRKVALGVDADTAAQSMGLHPNAGPKMKEHNAGLIEHLKRTMCLHSSTGRAGAL